MHLFDNVFQPMRVKSTNEDADINYTVYAAASKNVIYLFRLEQDFSEICVIQYFPIYEGIIKFFSISINQELFTICGDGVTSNYLSCRPLTQPSQPTTSIIRP